MLPTVLLSISLACCIVILSAVWIPLETKNHYPQQYARPTDSFASLRMTKREGWLSSRWIISPVSWINDANFPHHKMLVSVARGFY